MRRIVANSCVFGAIVTEKLAFLSSNKAKKMLETAKKRQEQDKAKAKASPRPKRVFSTGMWTMARASTRR